MQYNLLIKNHFYLGIYSYSVVEIKFNFQLIKIKFLFTLSILFKMTLFIFFIMNIKLP